MVKLFLFISLTIIFEIPSWFQTDSRTLKIKRITITYWNEDVSECKV